MASLPGTLVKNPGSIWQLMTSETGGFCISIQLCLACF